MIGRLCKKAKDKYLKKKNRPFLCKYILSEKKINNIKYKRTRAIHLKKTFESILYGEMTNYIFQLPI